MKRIVFVTFILSQLMLNPTSSRASGYDTCKLDANVLEKGKVARSQKGTVVSLSLEVVGLPECEGHGIKRFQAGQIVAADVVVAEGTNTEEIRKGTRLSLAYSYVEGLTPEGVAQSEEWKIVSVSKE